MASHARYLHQAVWTADLRRYLFERAGLGDARRVLEVGCGSGAILADTIHAAPKAMVAGLDRSLPTLLLSSEQVVDAPRVQADACAMPLAARTFDLTYCHFFLLWIPEALQAVLEMKRVTRVGGYVIAFAEPDYTSRVDLPKEFAKLGLLQTKALRDEGAVVDAGAHLSEVFETAGLRLVESGKLQRPTPPTMTAVECDQEWAMLEADLAGRISQQALDHWHDRHRSACAYGKRVVHIPTYFACAQV